MGGHDVTKGHIAKKAATGRFVIRSIEDYDRLARGSRKDSSVDVATSAERAAGERAADLILGRTTHKPMPGDRDFAVPSDSVWD
jgi:hypothetical protein